jgi:predicted Zn-dependent protease
MKKPMLIIIAVAVVLVALLYSLPKVVVDNDSESSPQSGNSTSSDSSGSAIHQASTDQIKLLDELKVQFASLKEGNQQKLELGVQVCKAYQQALYFDSALLFAEQIAREVPGAQSTSLAISTAYDAYTLATDKKDQEYFSEKVRSYFEQLPENASEYLDFKTKAAMTWVSTEQPMSGITMLREVLATEPNHREATFNLGMLSMQSGQFKKAVERFEALTTRDSSDVQAWFYLGLSEQELGNSTNARKAFTKVKALENDPSVIATVDNYLKELNN